MPVQAASRPRAVMARSLAGPALDPLLLGGLSLLIPVGVAALLLGPTSHGILARLEHWLALGLALPHFLWSYVLLYGGYRTRLREPRFLLAAAGVPAVLAALLANLYASESPLVPMRALVLGMFLLSSWHYFKQAFGCAIAACAMAGSPLSGRERTALRANLWALGSLAFVVPNAGPRGFLFVGLPVAALNLPPALAWVGYAALAGTGGWLAALMTRRPKAPAPAAIAAVLGFYAWSLPILVKPDLFFAFRFVPLAAALHSLQYLTFVAPISWRRAAKKPLPFAASWLAVVALGPVLFYRIPGWLDGHAGYDKARLGPIFFIAAVHLFVNIHHYFIDAVMWRRDNADLAALTRPA